MPDIDHEVTSTGILHVCGRHILRPLRDQILRQTGFHVDSVGTVEEGLLLLRENCYQLVLIDVEGEAQLPDAEAFCSAAKECRPEQLVAFVCNWRVAVETDCPDEILRTEFDPKRFVAGVRAILQQP